ncbi:MAG: PD-(D/E)XK nuclease domain-containing protein [Acidimicrobiales bacterium]
MSQAVLRSFALQIAELEDAIRRDWRWVSPEAAFVVWLAKRVGTASPVKASPIGEERWSEAPFLAALGFLFGAGVIGQSEADRWLSGMEVVSRKEPLPPDRASFMFRPVELLGITVGATSLERDSEATRWLRDALTRGEKLFSVDPWTQALTAWSARMVGADLRSLNPEPAELDVMVLDVLEQLPGTDADRFLAVASVEGTASSDLSRSAARWAALRATVGDATIGMTVVPPAATAADVVEKLCRRFPAFVAQLRQRHDGRDTLVVNDEYDVQDVLHAVLRLHFADVRDEEWGPSHAATSTRLDLLLKGERIVIETKMTRPSLTQKKLLDEIAIDKERYRSHPDCGEVVFFVFDPGGHLKNPVALENDASETIGTTRCRVIVAPREHGAETVI